jgi:hypothetical protein
VAHVGFLAPAVVDYALRIPVELTLRKGVEKWILSESSLTSVGWDAPKARRKPDAVTPLADIISKRKEEVSQCKRPSPTP